MTHIIRTLLVAALLSAAQSAWSIARDRPEGTSGPLVESPFPADAEASSPRPPLGSHADGHKPNGDEHTAEPFPRDVAGVLMD